jgi:uncharacterized membrane protein YuzA (DUF378 family)
MDIIKILGYGLIGLAAICVVASMTLISKESSKEKPNKEVLKTIRFYMIAGLIAIVVVGIFSMPSLNKSKDLSNETVGQLLTDVKEITSGYETLMKDYNALKASYMVLDEKCEESTPDVKPPKFDLNPLILKDYKYINKIDNSLIENPKTITNQQLKYILDVETMQQTN